MRKPVIGVTPLYDDAMASVWMLPEYLDGVTEAGGIPVILPLEGDPQTISQLVGECDGFLFTGGHDIDPILYGEQPRPYCGNCHAVRDRMETLLFQRVLEADKPVLGICRGLQFLNVALGGNLYQDLEEQHLSIIRHKQQKPYEKPSHAVQILPDTPLFEIYGRDRIMVNSIHHQAVQELAPALSAAALSEDGLVEAAYMPGREFVLGVQWHPEYLLRGDENQYKLFSAFVRTCVDSSRETAII